MERMLRTVQGIALACFLALAINNERVDGAQPKSFEFLPDISAMVELSGYVPDNADYDFRTRRAIHIDFLKVDNWFVCFQFNERDIFGDSPRQYDHELEYIGFGREISNGSRFKLFCDHTCNNPPRKYGLGERFNQIHWTEIGIGFETLGMKLGHRSQGQTNYMASLSGVRRPTECDYEWIFRLSLRRDAEAIRGRLFYVQLDLKSIYDDRGLTFSPKLEIGNRIQLSKPGDISLIQFLSYEYQPDAFGIGESEEFSAAGLRLEMVLGERDAGNPGVESTDFIPEFRIEGGYSYIYDSKYVHGSDVEIDIDCFKWDEKALSINTYVGMLTRSHFGNPYQVKYEIGPSLQFAMFGKELKLNYSYASIYQVDTERLKRSYSRFDIGLATNKNSPISWKVSAGLYPDTSHFDYWGDLAGLVRWDILEKGKVIPYLGSDMHCLIGDDSNFGLAAEAGVRFQGKTGRLSLYLRWQDDLDPFRYGSDSSQTLAGFGVEF